MRVLFVNAPWFTEELIGIRAGSRWAHTRKIKSELKYVPFPFNMAYAAAVLEKNNIKVAAIDTLAEEIREPEFLDRVKRFSPDLVVMECSTPSINIDYQNARKVKGVTDSKIAFVGNHSSALPKEVLKNESIDFALIGEYDYTLRDLALSFGNEKKYPEILGLAFKDKNKIHVNKRRPLIKNLDELPLPARHLFKMEKYNETFCEHHPNVQILTSRGCPFRCIFCVHPDTEITVNAGRFKISKIVDPLLDKDSLVVGNTEMNENVDGLTVLSHNGNFQKVQRVMRSKYSGELISIRTYYMDKPLKVTPEHKLFVYEDGEIKKIESRKITKKHKLILPIPNSIKNLSNLMISDVLGDLKIRKKRPRKIPNKTIEKIFELNKKGYSTRKIAKKLKIGKTSVWRYIKQEKEKTLDSDILITPIVSNGLIKFKYGKKWIPNKILINKDFLRLVGYYVAEGSVSFSKNRPNSAIVQFTFNEREKDYIKDVINILKNIFKIEVKPTYNKLNKTCQIAFSCSVLAHFFAKLFGANSYEMRFPSEFLFFSKYLQIELIKGAFRGDGGPRNRKDLGLGSRGHDYIFGTVSETLAEQMRLILLRCGFIPSTYRGMPKKAKNLIYWLIILGPDLDKIIKITGKKISKVLHRPKLGFIKGNVVIVPIRNISREKYSGYVYNFTVDGDNSYTSNGIAISNCLEPWIKYGSVYRARSVPLVLEEIKMLIDEYKPKEIYFDDSTFTVNEKRTVELCDKIIENGFGIPWSCMTTSSCIRNREMLEKMRKAGCERIKIGLESADENVLKRIGKPYNLEHVRKTLRWAKELDIGIHLTFMIGLPGETKESIKNTMKFIQSLAKEGLIFSMQTSIATPFPGTKFYEMALKNNWLTAESWTSYDGCRSGVISYPQLTSEEIIQLKNEIDRAWKYSSVPFSLLIKKTKRLIRQRGVLTGSALAVKRAVDYLYHRIVK